MKQKLISLLLVGILALYGCDKKQERAKSDPNPKNRTVQQLKSELEELLKADIPPFEFVESVDTFNDDIRDYDNELDRKIRDAEINTEADKLRTYFNRYNSFVGNFNSTDPEAALRTIDKLITDLERERFRHESELIKKFSDYNKYSGKNPFLAALRQYKEKANERIKEKKVRDGTFTGLYKSKTLSDGEILEFKCRRNTKTKKPYYVIGIKYGSSVHFRDFDKALKLYNIVNNEGMFDNWRDYVEPREKPKTVEYDNAALTLKNKWDAKINNIPRYSRGKRWDEKYDNKRRKHVCRDAIIDINSNYRGNTPIKKKLIEHFESIKRYYERLDQPRR